MVLIFLKQETSKKDKKHHINNFNSILWIASDLSGAGHERPLYPTHPVFLETSNIKRTNKISHSLLNETNLTSHLKQLAFHWDDCDRVADS
jgi:hypothetical protein